MELHELHESVRNTARSVVIKEHEGYRLRMLKHEVLSPKGLFSIDMVQESLDEDGEVKDSQTYNFFMDSTDIDRLCYALKA